jgi:hypothetical protein
MIHTSKKINEEIKKSEKAGKLETNDISDGYHTFGELYEHRIALFIALVNRIYKDYGSVVLAAVGGDMIPWKSKQHHDGTMFDGEWFIAGIGTTKGHQISYHLPLKYWDKLRCVAYDKAPVWDGHTPADVVERLLEL